MKKLIILILLAFMTIMGLSASPKLSLIRSYEDSLGLAQTPRDSLRLMFNLFDLDLRNHATNSRRLLQLASRCGSREEVLDIIRVAASLNSRDKFFVDSLMSVVKEYSDNAEVRESQLLIQLLQIEERYRKLGRENKITRSDIAQMIVDYKEHNHPNDAERLRHLFEIVEAVSKVSRGPLLASYIDSLQHLVERMNLPTGSVKYYIYEKTGAVFELPSTTQLAVSTDKKLLNVMDSLSREYARKGRPYSTFPLYRYYSYRRLLKNASALNDAEVEQYYQEARSLAEGDSVIASNLSSNRLLDIYYLMAKKEYAKALPLIEKQIYNADRVGVGLGNLYPLLYEAAKGVGNRELMRSASEVLYPLKDEELRVREQYRFNDMRILYQSDSIKANNAVKDRYVREREQAARKTHYIIMAICLIALIVLAIFIVFLARQRTRILEMAKSLKTTNEKLIVERNELQHAQAELIEARDASKAADRLKTGFINNMSHEIKAPLSAINEYSRVIVDCIPDERRTYLDKFANIIYLNTRLVLTLVNDVLDVASLERQEMTVTKESVSVDEICELALGNVFEGGALPADSPVQVVFNPKGDDVSIISDPQRVGQVLTNLLSNAKKFTSKGTITLDYTTDPAAKTITFSVADTGVGIPKGREEEIFSRFRQLDHTIQGTGLGLYISRLLADLLGGTVKVDTSYRGGARFEFTIPTGF